MQEIIDEVRAEAEKELLLAQAKLEVVKSIEEKLHVREVQCECGEEETNEQFSMETDDEELANV